MKTHHFSILAHQGGEFRQYRTDKPHLRKHGKQWHCSMGARSGVGFTIDQAWSALAPSDEGSNVVYAIGLDSKRHAIYTKGAPLGGESFRMAVGDKDGWIAWSGEKTSPMPRGERFDIKIRSGQVFIDQIEARWYHADFASDVVAYRPSVATH